MVKDILSKDNSGAFQVNRACPAGQCVDRTFCTIPSNPDGSNGLRTSIDAGQTVQNGETIK